MLASAITVYLPCLSNFLASLNTAQPKLSMNPDPNIFFAGLMLRAAPDNLLALLWRERMKVRVVRMDLPLTLALSREREREIGR